MLTFCQLLLLLLPLLLLFFLRCLALTFGISPVLGIPLRLVSLSFSRLLPSTYSAACQRHECAFLLVPSPLGLNPARAGRPVRQPH